MPRVQKILSKAIKKHLSMDAPNYKILVDFVKQHSRDENSFLRIYDMLRPYKKHLKLKRRGKNLGVDFSGKL